MKYTTKQGTQVEVPPNVIDSLRAMTDGMPDHSVGGILLGTYSDDQWCAMITEASPTPKDSIVASDGFERGVHGLAEMCAERWPNEYYIGEWHNHSAGNDLPTQVDWATMLSIATDEMWKCANPILVIVESGNVHVYVVSGERLSKAEPE